MTSPALPPAPLPLPETGRLLKILELLDVHPEGILLSPSAEQDIAASLRALIAARELLDRKSPRGWAITHAELRAIIGGAAP